MCATSESGAATVERAPLASDAVTQRLFQRWTQKGDPAARNALIDSYLPLAHSLAHEYENSFDSHDDLAQVASAGLATAVDRFDPTRGDQFATFAVPAILGELLS